MTDELMSLRGLFEKGAARVTSAVEHACIREAMRDPARAGRE